MGVSTIVSSQLQLNSKSRSSQVLTFGYSRSLRQSIPINMSSNDARAVLPPAANQLHKRHQSQILLPSRRSFPRLPVRARTKIRAAQNLPCNDWIFSSATNTHIAVDKSAFKTFTPLDSYVLPVSGSDPVAVRGIGSVSLRIRCRPTSSQFRDITLENVLYVPSWVCNIISDIYFNSSNASFEHKWTATGLQFTRRTGDKLKPWGYTESFCSLDRLVLSGKSAGRSPMLEDKEREIWSVNLNWPQSQRDKWDTLKSAELQQLAKEHEDEILAQQHSKQAVIESTELLLTKNRTSSPNPKLKTKSPISPSKVTIPSQHDNNMVEVMTRQMNVAALGEQDRRITLSEVSANLPLKKEIGSKVGSLKASFNANRGLLRDLLAAGTKH